MAFWNPSMLAGRICGRWSSSVANFVSRNTATTEALRRCFLSTNLPATVDSITSPAGQRDDAAPFVIDDKAVIHHGRRPRYRDYVKFKSPRKRASKLFGELQQEAVDKSQQAKPDVFQTNFRVGDSIELELIPQGGVKATEREKVRGVVLGKVNRGLGTSIYLRDVVFGEPVERKIPLHSPLVKSLRILEENFVFKKKRKVKRAKLYYLRDRNPVETRVTKW